MGDNSTTPSQCFILDSNSYCGPEYVGYPVLVSSFQNQDLLSTYLQADFVDAEKLSLLFSTNFGCSGKNLLQQVNNRRFHTSFQCSQIVNDAILQNCQFDSTKFPSVGPVLCENQCNLAVSSLKSIIENPEVCPLNETVIDARAQLVGQFTNYCATAKNSSASQGNLCVQGTPIENTKCGFINDAVALTGCTANPTDPCCISFLKTVPTSSADTNNNSTTSSDLSESSSKNANNGNPSSNGAGPGVIIGVVVGVLILLLFVVFFILRKKKNRQAKSISSAEQPLKGSSELNFRSTPSPAPSFNQNQQAINHASPPLPLPTPTQRSAADENPFNTIQQQPHNLQMPQIPLQQQQQQQQNLQQVSNNFNEQYGSFPPNNDQYGAFPTDAPKRKSTEMMVVVHPYYATLADELQLEVGADLILISSFDDGWALGMNPITGQQGAFPLVCVSKPDELIAKGFDRQSLSNKRNSTFVTEPTISNRNSSQIFDKQGLAGRQSGYSPPLPIQSSAKNPTVSQFYGEYY
ncbi:hypothetical protein HK099_001981, partial [Clydaea vesicula]